jgi:hypothetical protein
MNNLEKKLTEEEKRDLLLGDFSFVDEEENFDDIEDINNTVSSLLEENEKIKKFNFYKESDKFIFRLEKQLENTKVSNQKIDDFVSYANSFFILMEILDNPYGFSWFIDRSNPSKNINNVFLNKLIDDFLNNLQKFVINSSYFQKNFKADYTSPFELDLKYDDKNRIDKITDISDLVTYIILAKNSIETKLKNFLPSQGGLEKINFQANSEQKAKELSKKELDKIFLEQKEKFNEEIDSMIDKTLILPNLMSNLNNRISKKEAGHFCQQNFDKYDTKSLFEILKITKVDRLFKVAQANDLGIRSMGSKSLKFLLSFLWKLKKNKSLEVYDYIDKYEFDELIKKLIKEYFYQLKFLDPVIDRYIRINLKDNEIEFPDSLISSPLLIPFRKMVLKSDSSVLYKDKISGRVLCLRGDIATVLSNKKDQNDKVIKFRIPFYFADLLIEEEKYFLDFLNLNKFSKPHTNKVARNVRRQQLSWASNAYSFSQENKKAETPSKIISFFKSELKNLFTEI